MKNLMVLSSVLFSLTAFAGPEEHKDAQVCYKKSIETSAVFPNEVCIESLNINLENEKISAYSYFDGDLYEDLTVTYLARKNEDFYSFRSVSRLQNNLKLEVSGKVDNLGEADINYLNFKMTDSLGNTVIYLK